MLPDVRVTSSKAKEYNFPQFCCVSLNCVLISSTIILVSLFWFKKLTNHNIIHFAADVQVLVE
jgi:hypothetical protein